MNTDYVGVLERDTYRQFTFRATNLTEAVAWQNEFRPKLAELLGLDAISKHGAPPLTARKLSTVETEDHIREEWTLETEPGFHVPFFYLRPLGASGRLPLVITPHGHNKLGKIDYAGVYESEEHKQATEAGDRDIAVQAVRQGYAVIAPDMRAMATLRRKEELEKDAPNSCRHMQVRALLFGRTLIGERVWDISRLIDWASARDDIDPDAIVVTGNSGGGTVTLFAAAVDERIKVAIPGSYFNTFYDSIATIHHCDCNYIPGIMRYAEMYDVAGLIAPRAFMAVHGAHDTIYPIEATKKAYAHLLQVYKVFGAEERCTLSIGSEGHRYYKDDVWPFVEAQLRALKEG